jgi:hypothetical protein
MIPDLSLLSYLPVASFALAASGLAIRFFFPSGSAKQTLIAAVLIFLFLTCGLLWQQDSAQRKQVRRAADEIVKVIGNDKRTYEEIVGSLRQPSYQVVTTALTLLIDEQRIGSEDTTIIDKPPRPLRLRVYFVRSF